ncbi:MAG: GNAT family N-acetyltransferase [Bacillota bacterium]
MDSVKALKELALATRLRRLSDRLSKDVSLIYKKLNIDFEAKWFTLIYLLKNNSPVTITQAAADLGISHTAVKLLAGELIKKEYLTSEKGSEDERQRLIFITPKGRELCEKLATVWKEIEFANRELLIHSAPDFLSEIDRIEEELDKISIYERVWTNLNGSKPGELKVLEYSAKLKKHFQRLNYEWLEEYFSVEEKDKSILLHPKEKIINHGGTIFFALIDEEAAGTCAVIRHPGNKYELAKMAVTKKFQNRGIGKKLLEAAVRWVRKQRAKELYLLTNEKLIAANIIYKNYGFKRLENSPFKNSPYQRKTYAMKLDLSSKK